MKPRLLVASTNAGKVAEYRRMLGGLDVELRSLDELPSSPPEPPEDAPDFAENARQKALAYARETGLPTVADDAGLEVEALGGAPGVHSKRFIGDEATAEQRNRLLLALLEGRDDRSARFVCVTALAYPDGRVETFEGEIRGEIAMAPRGAGGFGYDPLFVVGGDGRTMAELRGEEKDAISHRGLAVAQLRARLAAEPR